MLLLACGKQAPPAPVPPPSAAPVRAQPTAAPAPAPPAPAPSALSEADVRATLDAWLAAQNGGNFAAYEQLYAAKFYGVKRAGERVVRFDRAGWLADRKRMFQKPMQVEAREPRIRAGTDSAQLELTQRWASGKFEDLGLKRLLLVRESGQLRIAQEEMLSSQLLAAPPSAAGGVHFVIALGSELYLALPEERGAVLAAEGPVRRETGAADKTLYVTSRATRAGTLPAWTGAKLRLDTGCVATVAELRVLSRVVPHFGTSELWEKGTEDPPSPPLPPQRIAEEAFALGTPLTAARLSGCSAGVLAVPESAPPPIAAEVVSDPALAARARSAFAALPSVKAQQREFLKDNKGQWWDGTLRIDVRRHPQSGQVLISALAHNGSGACEELGPGTWAVFELDDNQLRRVRESAATGTLEQALDVDGDGKLELITHGDYGTERELWQPQAESPAALLVYDYQDCPC